MKGIFQFKPKLIDLAWSFLTLSRPSLIFLCLIPLVLALFAMGLMTKPMLVTLPFVLLLLDYWPLQRFEFAKPVNKTNLM